MTKQNIVVVGAGYAGVSATKFLAKKFKKDTDVTITLIDRHSYHTMMTELHEVAGGRVEPEAIQYDLQRLFSRKKNVKLVTDTVTGIDKENKVVKTLAGSYPFDQLILGMGGEPNDFGTPGVKENGFTLWSFDDAVKIRHHIEATVAKAAIEPDAEVRKAMLTFVVCGSGFTGIEMVGELIDWKDRLAKDAKIDPDEITLMVVEAMPTILNMLSRNDAAKAERYLEKKNVQLLLNSPIVEVAADHIKLKDGSEVPTHTLIWTAGVKATSDAADFGLEAARGSRLVANEYMQAKGYEDKNIYIIGDLVYYEETPNTPTPQIVQAAEQTGHTAAANIVADIKGGEKHAFKGNYQGFMVSIGAKWGVANLFDKIHLSGFLAIIMKHIVNLKYFFDIRSGYYMFQYIMHEIFHIKDDRSVARGHTSRYGNVLWSVPLRVFYGMVWLVESMKKIVGNGDYLKPSTWFGDGSWFTDKVVFPFPWLQEQVTTGASQTTETATTAASGAADAAASGGADAATQAAHFGLSYAYGETPMQVFDHMPKWFESVMKFMMPNQEVALFMQKFMTIVEVCIALALIAGLFTWLSSAATIGLTIAFCLSGMFYWVNIWFIFVAFALMNGSGRAVGLDRWVIPWIQRKLGKAWYGTPKARYGGK
ncbi:FAD-dependent oxidoreductase [Enterococcus faecalis]|jgi:NADH dehydrogenase|uniref:NAD(P)/FAD-dependent oxidoreductase n=1 Tax=Enterococcus faecalis TaxID=1351 RepID=UPI00032FE538|nr:NAD(P)/FAD-dependent oxidoreductase [Enterococcus faecalis]EGO7920574.1 NAD(P)/FAD-dependent oxidoreductase [Enterococcus faecalis]EHK9494000.1 NAD(P)/FAD-dependent oxidoreductase [Enterococcus faecalis]EKG8980319.1 NAD(P)/FAD-dependent oxidoreductase [Enterococcus faecalis]EME3185887.1 NAD(P)/FAD-dependent oxidoreductase [Enterococcus faecalis]EOJ83110.1 pyridine nucleotide-disulfide family oxidoreductase [Enterococcus faecalis EnGen0357]